MIKTTNLSWATANDVRLVSRVCEDQIDEEIPWIGVRSFIVDVKLSQIKANHVILDKGGMHESSEHGHTISSSLACGLGGR